MPLKFAMSSLEGVEPAIAALYTEGDGGNFILTGVEGVTSKAKLDEFRNNNIELTKQLDKFKDIDPAKYAEMQTEIEEARIQIEANAGKLDEEAVNKIVESRVKTIQDQALKDVADRDGIIQTQGKQLETLIIDGNVTKAAVEHKVDENAITDVMLRAKTVFSLDNGKPVAKDADGNKMYGPDGTTELSIGEWVKGLIPTSPHLFQPSVTANIRDQHGNKFTGDRSTLSPLAKIQQGL